MFAKAFQNLALQLLICTPGGGRLFSGQEHTAEEPKCSTSKTSSRNIKRISPSANRRSQGNPPPPPVEPDRRLAGYRYGNGDITAVGKRHLGQHRISAIGLARGPADRQGHPAAAPESDQEPASRLIVGPDVKLKGAEILDCDTLVVEGRVEATMDSRVIRIAEQGSFAGKVGIDIAEIYGRFDGELTARQQLIIHATGRVSGTIRYGKILIEEGGEVSGDVKSLAHGESEAARVKPVVVSSNN